MGFCESKSNQTKKQNSQIIPELNPGAAKSFPLKALNELSKSVCKIILKKLNHTATGFFLYDLDKNCFLTTNYHVISPESMEQNPIISIEIYDGKIFDLNMSSYQNNIQYLKPLDATLIRINNLTELCNSVKFLEIDLNYKKGYEIYLKKDVVILGYPLGKSIESS